MVIWSFWDIWCKIETQVKDIDNLASPLVWSYWVIWYQNILLLKSFSVFFKYWCFVYVLYFHITFLFFSKALLLHQLQYFWTFQFSCKYLSFLPKDWRFPGIVWYTFWMSPYEFKIYSHITQWKDTFQKLNYFDFKHPSYRLITACHTPN